MDWKISGQTLGFALVEIFFGLILAVTPILLEKSSEWAELPELGKHLIAQDIPISFFVAAMLTLTFEPITHKRIQTSIEEQIEKIKSTSEDKILEVLTGNENIFNEIKNNVIRQDFIRKMFHVDIKLD